MSITVGEILITLILIVPFLFFYFIGRSKRIYEEKYKKNQLIKIEKEKEKNNKEKIEKEEYLEYLNKSSQGIDMEAMYNLAVCYFEGAGIKKNYVEAFYWVTKSELLGDSDAPKLREEIEESASKLQIAAALQRLKEETPK